jgi:hypothetical protein
MHIKLATIRNALIGIVTLIVVLGLAGMTVNTVAAIPDDAPVFLNSITRTFIAQPCIDARPTAAFFAGHPGTYAEAVRLNYSPDDICLAAHTLMGNRQSLTTLVLVKLGILQKTREWWDKR